MSARSAAPGLNHEESTCSTHCVLPNRKNQTLSKRQGCKGRRNVPDASSLRRPGQCRSRLSAPFRRKAVPREDPVVAASTLGGGGPLGRQCSGAAGGRLGFQASLSPALQARLLPFPRAFSLSASPRGRCPAPLARVRTSACFHPADKEPSETRLLTVG